MEAGMTAKTYPPVRSDLPLVDSTTLDTSTDRHGFTPKLPNDATKYLDGTGAFSDPGVAGGGVTFLSIAKWGFD